jgi:diadenosine tetraphosphate (Ap4A) HIT family hydrolase
MDAPVCRLCLGPSNDPELGRVQVWEDELWRLTTSVGPGDPSAGFSYLEPKRHVPHITDLEGDEAASFGGVLARCTRALKAATGADVVYVYIFGGGVAHLHVHLAPHREGDAYSDTIIKGEVEAIPSPGTRDSSARTIPLLPTKSCET